MATIKAALKYSEVRRHMLICPESDGERKSASIPPIPPPSTNKVGLWDKGKVTAKACFIRVVSGPMNCAVPHRSPFPEQSNFWDNFLRRDLHVLQVLLCFSVCVLPMSLSS